MHMKSFEDIAAKTGRRIPVVKHHTCAPMLYRRKFSNTYVITEPLKGPVIKPYTRLYSTCILPLIAFE
jgi:hypothetical protein